MSISIAWGTKVITIPQSFLTFISAALYELDVDEFRLALKDLEDSEDGSVFPDTHRHNTAVTLSGVVYARTVEIINGYTVTFEDGQYSVHCVGANHNLADVKNVNQVSLIVGNSAGLITVVSGSGVTEQDKLDIADRVWTDSERALTDKANFSLTGAYDPAKTAAQTSEVDLVRQLLNNRQEIQNIGGLWYLVTYADDDNTILVKSPLLDHEGNPIQPDGGIPSRRGRGV